MSTNINMLRIATRLNELFKEQMDMGDVENLGSENKQFETRSFLHYSPSI